MTLRRILAVTHETTLTGAPMNLLHLLRWITEHTDTEVHTLALTDGPLRHRFEHIAPVTVLDRSTAAKGLAVAQRGLVQLGSSRAWKQVARARYGPQLRSLGGFDLIYLNSIGSISVLPFLPEAPVVVSHVHELQVAMRTWRPSEEFDLQLSAPDAWIAASGAVRDMLVDEYELPAERVRLHHEFINAAEIAQRKVSLREVEQLRRELRIPADAAVVMGAGTVDWRKGPDLFVQLAAEVRRHMREPVYFVWVGGDLTGTDFQRVRADIERTGSDHVNFVGVKPDPVPWFAMADVFALTSHEDPFPLVCLEHAAMGHPIVTYRNGGMPELLEAAGPDAAAGIADHMDVNGLAQRLLAYLSDDQLRQRAGEQLRSEVLEQHDAAVAAERLYADLVTLAEGSRQPRRA
ncbi:MAG: glycosyltransferase family 4 protein [Actinomycetes bacterium]